MLHPLEQKIVALRRRVRRGAAVYGLSLVAAALLGGMVAAGIVDYLMRFEDRGLRIIVSLTALGISVWAGYRFLRPTLFARLTDVDLARRVELAFPALRNRLQSAIEFLRQPEDDPAAGSPALRRVVIAQAAAEAQGVEFGDVLDTRRARRAAAILAAVCLLSGCLIAVGPSSARIAAVRLLNPLSRTTWPRVTNLVIRQSVDRVARGGVFQIDVIDQYGAKLPADVRIHYRTRVAGGAVIEESERMLFAEGAVTARRENVQQAFAYRIDGGDDRSMPWSDVEAVDPPAVESLTIRSVPPAYTGWPATESPRHVRALVGTRLQITGRVTKPLRSAELCLEDGRRLAARLSDDGCSFTVGDAATPAIALPNSAELVVEKSGSYWFELIDRDGFRGGSEDRWEIHAVADVTPIVTIQQPAANLLVTPRAVVPIRVFAKDDLALREIMLVFRTSDAGPERTLPLWTSERRPNALATEEGTTSDDRRRLGYRWELDTLRLQPGAQVTVRAAAADYRPQIGQSEPRRLTVVTPDELLDRLAAREKLIAAELERALGMQRACRGQVESLRIRLAVAPQFEQTDVDQLQAAEHSQQDIARLITNRGNGLPSHVLALLADLENNRIPGADVQRRMVGLLEELDRLGRRRLPTISRELTAARKTVQADREANPKTVSDGRRVGGSLTAAAGQQDAVIATLEQWLRQLARWDSYGRFHREIAQLLREQEELAHRTADVARRTLAQDLRDLPPSDAAELAVAGFAELELARRLDRTLQEMEQEAVQLRPNDPLAADTMADALDAARRLAIAAAMRTTGAEIGQNQIGQAVAGQKQIAQDLQEVLDLLANRQAEAARLVKRLRQLDGDLSALEASQAALSKQIDSATSQSSTGQQGELQQLGRQQQLLRQEAERLTRQLERLQSERAAAAAGQAAKQMDRAGQSAAKGDRAEANRQAGDAQQSLAEARRELAERARQAAAELAFEQLARLDDAIKHLCRLQQGALEEARRLWALERSQGELTRAQAAAVGDLSRLQHTLGDDAARTAKQLGGVGAFQLALSTAIDEMQAAAGSLDRRQTGPPTQEPQQRAVRQLSLVVEAIKPELPAAAKADDAGPGAGGQQGRQPAMPPTGIPPIAELKLLRLLQVEINSGVERLQEALTVSGRPTDEQARQCRDLSRRQARLAEIIEQSLRQSQPAEQERPEAKPKGNRKHEAEPQGVEQSNWAVNELVALSDRQPTDEELRRELGAAAEKEDDSPMLQLARQMRDSQRRIDRADTGDATQKLQRRIVGELDRLIEQSRQKQGQCQPGACQSKPAAQPAPKPTKPGAAAPKSGNKPAAAPSTRPSGESRSRKVDAERTRTTMKQLWGELPEHAREQMLQLPDEEFPPKYERLIEDYFRRLAEEKQER